MKGDTDFDQPMVFEQETCLVWVFNENIFDKEAIPQKGTNS